MDEGGEELFHVGDDAIASKAMARRWLYGGEAGNSRRWTASIMKIENELWMLVGECCEDMDDARLLVATWLGDRLDDRNDAISASKEVQRLVEKDAEMHDGESECSDDVDE